MKISYRLRINQIFGMHLRIVAQLIQFFERHALHYELTYLGITYKNPHILQWVNLGIKKNECIELSLQGDQLSEQEHELIKLLGRLDIHIEKEIK